MATLFWVGCLLFCVCLLAELEPYRSDFAGRQLDRLFGLVDRLVAALRRNAISAPAGLDELAQFSLAVGLADELPELSRPIVRVRLRSDFNIGNPLDL